MIDGERLKPSGRYGVPTEKELADESRVVWDTFESYKNGQYVEPKYMAYSDYGGSLIERSNVEEFMEQFADHQGVEWWERYGSHGSRGIVVRRDADARVPEIGEFFEALDTYPIANEDRHSELEHEEQERAWKDWGHYEFRRFLEDQDRAPVGTSADDWEDFIAQIPDDVINRVWWEYASNGNGEEVRNEGQDVIFDFDRALQSSFARKNPPHVLIDDALKKRLPKTSREHLNRVLPQLVEVTDTWPDETVTRIAQAGQEGELLPVPTPPRDRHMFQRLIDYLLENDGEWSPVAQDLLTAAYA